MLMTALISRHGPVLPLILADNVVNGKGDQVMRAA
jgi:hypothetical protein